MRFWIPLFAAVVLVGPARAGGEAVAGSWKVTIFEDSQYLHFWLLKLEVKDGKLIGTTEPFTRGFPEATVEDAKVDGDLLTLSLVLPKGIAFNFEGKLPRAGGKKIFGSVTRQGHMTPAYLESTAAKSVFDANVEILTRTPTDPRVFGALLGNIGQAKAKKATPREIKEWTEAVLKTGESYGPTLQTDFAVKLIGTLETDYPELAAEMGLLAEKSLDPQAPVMSRLRVLTSLAGAYKALNKPEEIAKIDAQVAKLEDKAYAENVKSELSFKIDPYAGKVGQPALVELFTGAQCPPCVGADIGFDALGHAFKETEAVLLQYHVHVPGADALANAATEARAKYYEKTLEGTPAIYFNGQSMAPGGGGRSAGKEKYQEYRGIVEKLIAKEPRGKLTLTAARKGDVITIQTSGSIGDVKGKVRLRVVLTEDWTRYKARNGTSFHHHVVRAMPGGAEGFAVDKSVDKTLTVNLADVRAELVKYLDDFVKAEGPFPDSQRPMRLRDLHVVAFLQNDDNNEVLQAMSVRVKE